MLKIALVMNIAWGFQKSDTKALIPIQKSKQFSDIIDSIIPSQCQFYIN